MKHILQLSAAWKISSGKPGEPALKRVQLTRNVNEGLLLMPGTVSAAMLEASMFLDPAANMVRAGQQMELFQEIDGVRTSCGIFFAEKVEWTGSHSCTVTAYDSITLLDKDVTAYLNGLGFWPISLGGLARLVCNHCGLTLVTDTFPNSEVRVNKPAGYRITGRQVMKWICQLAGCFCRAVGDRRVELTWYAPASVRVGPAEKSGKVEITYSDAHLTVRADSVTVDAGGITVHQATYNAGELTVVIPSEMDTICCFRGGFRRSNEPVAAIDGVRLAYSYAAGSVTYPQGGTNLLSIVGNHLLEGLETDVLTQMTRALYGRIGGASYTTCQLKVPADANIQPGQILEFSDGVRWFSTYVMRTVRTGGADQVVSTGEYLRDNPTAFNNPYEHLR